MNRRSDRNIETSDRCEGQSQARDGMEAASTSDSFVVTGVSTSCEIGAFNQVSEEPPCLENDPALLTFPPSPLEYRRNPIHM